MKEPPAALATVGRSERRVDSVKLATGRGTFVDDVALPGMLHARILHSPHAHARIRRIDASRARAMPGVALVLTHEDVPRVPYTTAGQGWPEPSPYDAVMLDSKVLYIGGGGASGCPSNVPKNSAEIIDLAAASPVWSSIASMKFGRRHHNATILADGKVLVTGGTSVCGFSNEAGAVFTAEMWNPATNTWSSVAPSNVMRVYHSTTMLLPDGRVFQSGSGEGAGTTAQYNYEIYSPPYLFKGARPTYIPSGTAMHYGQPFSVSTPNAASIRKVLLIRLASSTHAFDMGQRLNTVAFQMGTDGQSLVLTPPASGRIAPPGPYMLFIVNDQGVPSVAHIIVLSQ